MKAPYITDQFKTLVERVSDKILTQLQAADATIQAISYEHGRKFDIQQLLKQKDESPSFDTKGKVYPMVWLYEPFTVKDSPVLGCWARVQLSIAIFNPTVNGYTPEQRYEKNFKPILDPIYEELINQIDKSGWYHVYDSRVLKNDMTRRMMWGSSDNKNELNNYVDAIEINSLTLDVYYEDECSES
jgi:hypothetical protein